MDRTLSALLVACLAAPALASPPELPQYSRDRSLGVASCASSLCHGSVEPWRESRVPQNEYVDWARADRHARAYDILLGERSAQIARRLGLKEPAHRADLCLDCHAHNAPAARRSSGFVLSDGVGCEACHGPAERWIKSHAERGATRPGNVAKGLFPVADDQARARLCLSCHSANPQKLVTHRMMAAGHPRLSFEIDTFTQLQAVHYRKTSHGVRLWALGQALAAEQQLGVLIDPRRPRGLFPELVPFDCHACHHPMSDKRNAGARTGLAPGAVRLNDAHLLMVRHIARRVDAPRAEALAGDIGRLQLALAGGDDALDQARRVRRAIEELVPKIAAHAFPPQDLRGILLGLIDDGLAGEYSDYQGAEQAAMALQAVADLMARRGLLRPAAVQPALRGLLAAVAHDERYTAGVFARALSELRVRIEEGTPQ